MVEGNTLARDSVYLSDGVLQRRSVQTVWFMLTLANLVPSLTFFSQALGMCSIMPHCLWSVQIAIKKTTETQSGKELDDDDDQGELGLCYL